ncbi:acyl-CoA dehydrogenase family protein [Streptomyces hydrogenans]|uniref:acyl-CoA dehydrogenase family protein n=1 Tax=Streptomyces hydrogenans TaxID=1873719 RepID=UPI0033BD7025
MSIAVEPASSRCGNALADAMRGIVLSGESADLDGELPGLLSRIAGGSRTGLAPDAATARSYAVMRALCAVTDPPSVIVRDVHRLCAVHDWAAVAEPTAGALMSVHYNLCVASIVGLSQRPEYTRDLLAELDDMRSVGLLMATEGTTGNDLTSIRTRARYDEATDSFVLTSPDAAAHKVMSTSAYPGVAKIAVVIARLDPPAGAGGRDRGPLHAFLVRIATQDGPVPGVSVTPLSRGLAGGMDYARTGFHGVAVPRTHWLAGPRPDGADADPRRPDPGSLGRFWLTLDCLKLGRILLPSMALATARASLAITVRYSLRRMTRGAAWAAVPALSQRNHRAALMTCLSRVYAATALVNDAKDRWAAGIAEPERTLMVNSVKVHASYTALSVIDECRERAGARGMLLGNRIAEYLGIAHGAVTAEGDNQVIALALGRLLAARPPAHLGRLDVYGPAPSGGAFDAARLRSLLQARVRGLLGEAARIHRASVRAPGRETAAEALRDAALAYADAEAFRSLGERIPAGGADAARCVLEHYGLGAVLRHADWYLAHGLLDLQSWNAARERLEHGHRELAEIAQELVDAFGYAPEFLGAPMQDGIGI